MFNYSKVFLAIAVALLFVISSSYANTAISPLSPSTPSIALSPEDKAAIEKSISQYTGAWNKRQMKAFGEVYTADASFINVLGVAYHGRAEIAGRQLKMHQKNDSKLEIKEISLREVRSDVVIALVQWRIVNSGMPAAINSASDTRDGVLTQVFLKEGGRWLITASHNTFHSSVN